MKEKIIYIVSFLLAFVIVTGLMIYLNSACNNIFAFDFSPTQTAVTNTKKPTEPVSATVPPKDSTAQNVTQIDTLKAKQDTTNLTTVTLKDSNAVSKISKKIAEEIKPAPDKSALKQEEPIKTALSGKNIAKRDSSYNIWVKSTVKLYESMETRKAAKIIQGYSDNIARDILMKMKKKKAAEILAEFKPEIASRIISVVQ